MKAKLRALGRRWPWLGRVLAVNERVGELNGNSVASSVTLTVFVSLFPLALAAIAIVGFLAAGNADVPQKIIDGLSLKGSAADTVRTAIANAQRSRKAASIVGFAGLFWSGLGVTSAISMAVRIPWQVKPEGLKARINGVVWILGAVVLGGGSVAIGAVLRILPDAAPKVLTSLLVIAVGLLVEVGFFLWTFWILGDRRPGWRALLPGAILGAVGFEVLKRSATLYLPRLIASSSSLYGPLGVVFAILAWLALFARLLVFTSTLNAVTYEQANGSVSLTIHAPNIPGGGSLMADRGGSIVPVDPESDPPTEERIDPTDPDDTHAGEEGPHGVSLSRPLGTS